MIDRSLTLRLLSASTLAFAFAQPALAQDVDSSDTEATGAEEADNGQLDMIVVTANRREENLQQVPVSAATLSADATRSIFDAGADITALSAHVPGLFVESSNGRAAPRFYIRGLGNTDFDLAASQPVSVVMDDVVHENVTLKSFPIFDVERVEVLRGPQGTLFGRNTPAGIVKIDTVKPGDDFAVTGSASYGSFGSVAIDGGVTIPVAPGLASVRLSGMWQQRDNWVDNGFTGEEDVYGAYTDIAGRAQILLTPSDRLSILGSYSIRDLDGTSTLFRANILGPGDNDLNENYDRDTVFYDAGAGNQAQYKAEIITGKVDYEADFATFTSITSWADSEGSSRGDIDGGFGAAFLPVSGPGFIPFPSDTQDSIELDQFTQEVRLASNGGGALNWQVGGFYFDSDFDVTTVGFDFPPSVTVNHTNESWAVFGQVTSQLTDTIKLTGGLRYTEDDKAFFVRDAADPQAREVSDERLSWDLAAFVDLTADASVYARVASGFRAPTIQGRDVAFFAPPSIATSEKIMSYEVGFKSELADRRVRLNGAAYFYNIEDPQFSAVGGAGNLVQLVNAADGRGWGFELDSAFQITPNFLVTAGASYNNTEIRDENLAVGICAQCTVLDPIVNLSGTDRALVDGNPFPNAPEWIADLTARYAFPLGNVGELFAYTDWTYQGETSFFLYDSAEYVVDNQIEGGLRVGYAKQDGTFEVALFARNITDADNVKGGIDFNNNTAFVNDPRVIGLSVRFDY
ncbi:TonB-dependent receptor [Qipengyuania nanhaisediminis]|uniref:Outer membrane receptor proteins, mostly Fe transport n=1 Tax=Qipengyuania nanhaisediminis TaxID=604088 RepID=A0A1I5PLE1_9SPHN|nr:TonB-dependent receptor [Qipengyuania nanhaisediminis]SFP34351.1 Outer membrane receptor proteins, mostly Fe transport [Qipengyuania nanhaisediminis]